MVSASKKRGTLVRKHLGGRARQVHGRRGDRAEALTGGPVHNLSEPRVAHCEVAAIRATSSFVRQVLSIAQKEFNKCYFSF